MQGRTKFLPLATLLIALSPFIFSSCFTGVESTKKITLSKDDRKLLKPTEEERFFNNIEAIPLEKWEKGHPFYAADDRTLLIFDQQGLPSDIEKIALGGKTLSYQGFTTRLGADGNDYVWLTFSDGDNAYNYNTGKRENEAMKEILSDALPMMVDLGMIHQASLLLSGKKLWTRTALWYNSEGDRIEGKKFVPVNIKSVEPGTMVFPIKVVFTDENNEDATLFLNFGHSPTDSRSFSHIFSLSDIRKKYPSISDEVWELICSEKIRNGMTKEECRLSLGNPTEVSAGHDYSQTLDLWHYQDGTVLWFEDGLLTRFRK